MGYFIKERVKCWCLGDTQEAQITQHSKLPVTLPHAQKRWNKKEK